MNYFTSFPVNIWLKSYFPLIRPKAYRRSGTRQRLRRAPLRFAPSGDGTPIRRWSWGCRLRRMSLALAPRLRRGSSKEYDLSPALGGRVMALKSEQVAARLQPCHVANAGGRVSRAKPEPRADQGVSPSRAWRGFRALAPLPLTRRWGQRPQFSIKKCIGQGPIPFIPL